MAAGQCPMLPAVGSLKAARAKAKEESRTLGSKIKQRKLLMEVREEAAEFAQGLSRYMDPADAIQQVLDNIIDRYEYATQKVYELDESEYWRETMGGSVPHEWIREQERLALQVVHIASKAAHIGLAERRVRVAESQAALFAQVVDRALLSMGLGPDERRKAHELIAAGMMDIEGTAELIGEAA